MNIIYCILNIIFAHSRYKEFTQNTRYDRLLLNNVYFRIEDFNMDKLISKLARLGVPALVIVISMGTTGLTGAAVITAGLALLGSFGIMGGIATLGVITLLAQGLTEYGFDAIFTELVREFFKRGETKRSIYEKIDKYPVSKSLKRKLKEELEKI